MTQAAWAETDLSGQPRLLLGQRKSSKRIDVHRVEVHRDLFADLRSIAADAIGELQRREPKTYSTFASKTSDDYFEVDVSAIPERHDKRRKDDDPESHEMASALALVADCDTHPVMTAEELRAADASLYAIVFETEGSYVGFIRNTSPRKPVRPGMRYLQFSDTLKKLDPPDLAIDDDVDLVVGSERCAILSPSAFTTLFGDVGVAFERVQVNLTTMSEALKGSLTLSSASVAALHARCGRRVSDAKRLNHIAIRRGSALQKLKADDIEALLQKRGLKNVINDGELRLSDDDVSTFLDVVEGRLFNDDVTGEERRADSYSTRNR